MEVFRSEDARVDIARRIVDASLADDRFGEDIVVRALNSLRGAMSDAPTPRDCLLLSKALSNVPAGSILSVMGSMHRRFEQWADGALRVSERSVSASGIAGRPPTAEKIRENFDGHSIHPCFVEVAVFTGLCWALSGPEDLPQRWICY
jgi:hypothetical protein